jgi:hypothetical protein
MPRLHPFPTARADADVQVEASQDRSAGNLDLKLLIGVRLPHPTAARRTTCGGLNVDDLVGLHVGKAARSLRSIVLARFSSRQLGACLGHPFGEGGRLSFGGPHRLGQETVWLANTSLQLRDASLQHRAPRASLTMIRRLRHRNRVSATLNSRYHRKRR